MASRSAFVLGYTGATGSQLVKVLAAEKYFSKVVLIGRREVDLSVQNDDGRFVQKTVDFDRIRDYEDAFRGCDYGFCCLGGTKGRDGKSGVVKIDRDYVIATATVAKAAGCKHFLVMSSNGAKLNSFILILRTKAEMERGLKELNFQRLTILRPSMLLCERQERRVAESVLKFFLTPFIKLSPTDAAVHVETVAKAMVVAAREESPEAVVTLENPDIHRKAAALELS